MTPDEMRARRRREVDRLARQRRRLAQLNGQPTSLIDVTPIRRRLNQLHDLGWSFHALAAIHGQGTPVALNLIATGTSRRCERKFAGIADIPLTVNVPDEVADNMWVPTLGATRRIRALMAIGWRHEDISEAIGRSSHSLANATYLRTRAIDWRIVDAVYERMSAGRGDSIKTARRAASYGYAPPFGWMDIDDPTEKPRGVRDTNAADPVVVTRILNGDWTLPANPAERREVIARWTGSLSELGRLTGWNIWREKKSAA